MRWIAPAAIAVAVHGAIAWVPLGERAREPSAAVAVRVRVGVGAGASAGASEGAGARAGASEGAGAGAGASEGAGAGAGASEGAGARAEASAGAGASGRAGAGGAVDGVGERVELGEPGEVVGGDADGPAFEGGGTPELPEVAPPRAPVVADADALRRYAARVRTRMVGHKRYPTAARRRGREGTARIRLEIGANGQLARRPGLEASSGHADLDREAVRMAEAAAPYPAPPEGTPDPVSVVVPVRFSVSP